MNKNKIIALAILIALSLQSANAAFKEIECSTDPVFSENKCNQCFDGGNRSAGESVGMLNDLFVNKTTNPKLMYKEEQKMPFVKNLGGENSEWKEVPGKDGFWEYTPEFDATHSSEQDAYVVAPGKNVMRIKSKTGYAYKIEKNKAKKGENIGLLIYPVVSHDLVEDEVSIDTEEHRECVLFKSGEAEKKEVPVEKVEPTTKVKTGPEHFILVGIALLLALGVFGLRRKNS